MPKYKIAVSKNQKRYTIVFEAETEKQARDRVHKEWYSILAIEEFSDLNLKWNKFYFEAEKDWEIKKWKVVWDDLFKVYLKLKEGLLYDIKKIYSESDSNLDDNSKNKILRDLEQQYIIYKNLNKKKDKTEKNEKTDKNSKLEDVNIDKFYLKKELEDTYKLIDHVLEKLKNLIEQDLIWDLAIERKQKIKNIYNSIVKIRNSKNISKLKEVWELALLKIWSLELESLEKNHNKEAKELLKWTNKLLKEVWSNKQFVEKSRDIKYILWSYYQSIQNYFKSNKKEKKTKGFSEEEKWTYSYLNTILLISKYKKKKNENTIDILKNIILFINPFSKNDLKEELLIKRKVIKQNILILKSKINWKSFSYTRIVKWYNFIFSLIFSFFTVCRKYLFYTVLLYSLFFLIFLNLHYYWFLANFTVNYDWIHYFLILLFVYLAIYFSRWIITLSINFVFLSFIIIFWVVNF